MAISQNDVDSLLSSMVTNAEGVSDLFFVSGKPPQLEVFGKLKPFVPVSPENLLTPEYLADFADFLMGSSERLRKDFLEQGACDCSYGLAGLARFRVNIYRQNGSHAIVMRKLQSEVPTFEKIGLRPIFSEMIKEKTGLIFVTGATGSGKTTTLAAMLNEINRTEEIHVVTLEDPIEFMHPHLRATFSQRELGQDFFEFSSGLRSALRQAPKVIFVGEIRDRETMEIALTAGETGHLVFSTLHTINAGQTINRILGMFRQEEEQQVRQRLAETLRYIVSQRLVAKIGGGRALLQEIMGTNLRIRETVALGESENRSFAEIIEASASFGWQSFDQALIEAYSCGSITAEMARLLASSKSKVIQGMDAADKTKGVGHEVVSGLKLQVKPVPTRAAVPPPLASVA